MIAFAINFRSGESRFFRSFDVFVVLAAISTNLPAISSGESTKSTQPLAMSVTGMAVVAVRISCRRVAVVLKWLTMAMAAPGAGGSARSRGM